MEELHQLFAEEFDEQLQIMEQKLLELDSSETVIDDLNAIFRGAHSIKGSGGALGFMTLYNFTHVMETLMDDMRAEKVVPTEANIDALLKAVDILKVMQEHIQVGTEMPEDMGEEVMQTLNQYTAEAMAAGGTPADDVIEETTNDNSQPTWIIDFKPGKHFFESLQEPAVLINELSSLGEDAIINLDTNKLPLLKDLDPSECHLSWNIEMGSDMPLDMLEEVFELIDDESSATIIQKKVEAPVEKPAIQTTVDESGFFEITETPKAKSSPPKTEKSKPKTAVTKQAATSIRVDVSKVDRMVNMIGELVITQSMLYSQLQHIPTDEYPQLTRGMQELARHTRELQESVMAMRMQPVKSIFTRIPRLVRDLSIQLEKKIELVTSGESTEIDKTIIEQLSDPLTHMIRNSADHGLETTAERIKAGKPEVGKIYLSADNSGGKIVIEIEDDGAGIDRDRVHRKAIEKGIVAVEDALTDEEIDQLVFAPGFSTAESVSTVSGRGVGMDVVNKNIQDLGGNVSIKNRPGEGVTFTLSLPLTLAILDGMIVQSGEEKYILPVNNIIETIKPSKEAINSVADTCAVINIRSEILPLINLAELFNIPGAKENIEDSLVVVVDAGRNSFGLIVDQLLGQQQIVIKSLEENADPVPGISGATILGDGEVSLIIDVQGIWRISDTVNNKTRNIASQQKTDIKLVA